MFQGDRRCRLGGQDPNDPVRTGSCSIDRTPCDVTLPDQGPGSECGIDQTCEACGGTHTSADPAKGSPRALPVGYRDLGLPELRLVEAGRIGVLNGVPATLAIEVFTLTTTGATAATFIDNDCIIDRCVLGAPSSTSPGSPGIGGGGSFAPGQRLAFGGRNRSSTPVSWSAEDTPPDTGRHPFVRVSSFGPGPDGIPGCFGGNSTINSGDQACRKRLGRGLEPDSFWGHCEGAVPGDPDYFCESSRCQGGTRADLPCADSTDCPGGTCPTTGAALHCGLPNRCLAESQSGNVAGQITGADQPAFPFNTGLDDVEILVELGVPGVLQSGTPARFRVPNPLAPFPLLHGVSAESRRDLEVFFGDRGVDLIRKSSLTLCPIVNGSVSCTAP